ncbi:MAG: tetratricopeptide repeat protein [Proteobacteria bacterium]|nr:tetratricopeptide repeat protein [Pseudomonadota bacterium]
MAEDHITRKLTAILCADVVGYSRLMGVDEEGTHRRLSGHLDTFARIIGEHGGAVVNYAGDAVLAEFSSVIGALECALAVQEHLRISNADESEDNRLDFRIGINLGDVIVDRDDIFGGSVNIAARLETLADPGGICVSGRVYDDVLGKLECGFEFLGEKIVKNIERPIRVYKILIGEKPITRVALRVRYRRAMNISAVVAALAVIGVGGWFVSSLTPGTPDPALSSTMTLPDKPSIAVLPFNNMSGDPDQEYFSDGITEDLITDLSKVSGLFVIARNSSFAYKGRNVNIQEVARALGVRYILEGSVRKAGGRVRINAQLIDSTTGGHVWAERFDRELADIFAIQDEVTQKIVAQLAIKLKPEEAKRLTREIAIDPEAYDLFLRGLERMQRFTPEYLAEARDLLSQSIMIDPRYARAFGVMAYTLVLEVSLSYDVDAEKNLQLAERYIHSALLLDDQVANVHFALSFVRQNQNRPEEGIAAARKAVELDTNYANGYAQLASALIQAGRPEEAIEAVETAIRLSPSKPFFYVAVLGRAYFMLGRYRQAAEAYQQVVAKNPAFILGHLGLAASYGHLGMIDEAEWEAIEVLAIQPEFTLEQGRRLNNYKRPEDQKRYIEGLRLAGLPE